MRITSSAFDADAEIPTKYTCDGDDVSPELTFEDVPDGAGSLVLIVDDPDAPDRVWVHWLAWGLPADIGGLPEGVPGDEVVGDIEGMRQGRTDFDDVGYGGPCPPPGHGTHHYRFTLYAPDRHIDLDAGAGREALEEHMEGHVIDEALLVGTYQRR